MNISKLYLFVRRILTLNVLLLGWVLSSLSFAQAVCPLDSLKPKQVKSLESIKDIAVLDQGRIKPLETYGKNLLLQLSGKSHYQKEKAIHWTARFLFAPRTTYDDKIFLINNPDIPEALRITPHKDRRYSYRELEPGFDKLKELAGVIQSMDEKNLSVVDKEILRVYGNLFLYIQLSGAFSYAIPHPDFLIEDAEVKKTMGLAENQDHFSFLDILNQSAQMEEISKKLDQKTENEWNDTEKRIVQIFGALNFWTEHYADCPIGLIPSADLRNEEWYSPMDTILIEFNHSNDHREIKLLRDLAVAYWNGTQLEFDMSARAFKDSINARLSPHEKKSVERFSLELMYNKLNFLFWAKCVYLLAFLIFLISLISSRKFLYPTAVILTLTGFVFHLIALVLRILIMARPPVTNLFETFIFVGLISAALGLILERINKNWLGVAVSSFSGYILLTIAGKFGSDGDTMQMLVAVLNSNFWLSTHVIAITIGYAGCCVAGVMGHIYILQLLSSKVDQRSQEITFQNMLGVLGFGLTMSFLGTTLGGIWADQSWGRFWGWDPKENGALMIVLWSSIIFHARLAKIINPLGVAVGCVLTLVNVVWAWFGVNLLSVGLHSYGFTSGLANTLYVYLCVEIIFISVTVLILGQKNIKI